MKKLDELEASIRLLDLSQVGAVQIGPGVTVEDPVKFVESHINTLRRHSGNITFISFYYRLEAFYQAIT